MKLLLHSVFTILFCFYFHSGYSQSKSINYYLPDIKYDKNIPTPESVFGFQIGDWHLSHDQLVRYMYILAEQSPRVTLTEYARTYEGRPLIYLTITSEDNHKKLDKIKKQHQRLVSDENFDEKSLSDMPAVLYQGFSIHGNEPSGGNAAPLVAYYLAAGKSKEVQRILKSEVILLDPCYNPDGFNRFASWANTHKNATLTSDPQDIEYNEPWPRGRTNHYWFDLNRDWLLVQLPESQGRIKAFHDWHPNVLTDHHEMGTNATYFFMPGESTRIHPLTPPMNQELTADLADYFAASLDEIGSLYYSGESFDDFYIGKGSTYPDVNGCVGILFEQASSRGHLQESDNGLISFPFTIRNHVATALATHRGILKNREKILHFQRAFFRNAMKNAKADKLKAYVFSAGDDHSRQVAFLDWLDRQQIEVYQLGKEITIQNQTYLPQNAFVVPLEQQQYTFIKAAFESRTTFEDSLFYDVSAWTLPLAFNLRYSEIKQKDFSKALLGNQVHANNFKQVDIEPEISDYAYLMPWDDYLAPRALHQLLSLGLRAKVAIAPLQIDGRNFRRGTIMIPVQNQTLSPEKLNEVVQEIAKQTGVEFFAADSGYTPSGPDFGSPQMMTLQDEKVMLMAGRGTSSYQAGAIWHLLDRRYKIPVSKVSPDRIGNVDLSKYTVIIMATGGYNTITKQGVEALTNWVEEGGVLIAFAEAAKWASKNRLINLRFKSAGQSTSGTRTYADIRRDNGARYIGGAIAEAKVDLTHPLLFGIDSPTLPLFRKGTLFMEKSKNPYATPMVYTDSPIISGYANAVNKKAMANSAASIVFGKGRGRIVVFMDDLTFRAYWWGTAKILGNAIFFGRIINGQGVER